MDRGDRHKVSQTDIYGNKGWQREGRGEKGTGQGRKANHRTHRDRHTRCFECGPACGSEPLQPWLDRSSQVGLGWEVACRKGLLQALGVPGLKFSLILEGGPATAQAPHLWRRDDNTNSPFPGGCGLPDHWAPGSPACGQSITQPSLLVPTAFCTVRNDFLLHPCPRPCTWGFPRWVVSLLVHPGPRPGPGFPQPELLSLSCQVRMRMTSALGGLTGWQENCQGAGGLAVSGGGKPNLGAKKGRWRPKL